MCVLHEGPGSLIAVTLQIEHVNSILVEIIFVSRLIIYTIKLLALTLCQSNRHAVTPLASYYCQNSLTLIRFRYCIRYPLRTTC